MDFDKYFKVQRNDDPAQFLSKITLFKNVFKSEQTQQKTKQQKLWTNSFKNNNIKQKDDQRIQMNRNKVFFNPHQLPVNQQNAQRLTRKPSTVQRQTQQQPTFVSWILGGVVTSVATLFYFRRPKAHTF